MVANEAFSRVRIDAQLKDAGWTVADGRSVRLEVPLSDGTCADYVVCDEQGRPLAVLEAKRASASLGAAEAQAIAHFRPVAIVIAQADLARRIAVRTLR